MARSLLCLMLVSGLVSLSSAVAITPVLQVVNMLKEMESKGKTSMAVEKKVFSEYSQWAKDQGVSLSQEITTGKSTIEKLIAYIDKTDSDVAMLKSKIAGLDADMDQMSKQLKDETAMREEQHATFLKTEQDYSESVEALEMAISTLKTQSYDRPQAMLQLQKMAGKVPAMRRVIALLLETDDQKAAESGAPAVAAYEFQSDRIVEVLEGLLTKFKGYLSETVSEETNEAHAFALSEQHLQSMIADLDSHREEDASTKASLASDSAEAKGELASVKADLAEDKATLADVKATFVQKESQFVENQQVRADELKALAEAIAILSDPSVSASYAKHIKFTQLAAEASMPKTTGKKTLSFLQVQSHSAAAAQAQARGRVERYLRSKADAISSKILAQAASEVAANPFAKVIDMIKSLLTKLKEEAAKESDHKQWCDAELAKNKAKREKKSTKVEALTAKVDELSGKASAEAQEISKLSAEQAQLQTAMTEATAQRQKEKEVNLATIEDAKAAIAATEQAVTILKEFYASQSALLQAKQVPELAAYKGQQNAKGGVVGMLEVILTDFRRLETETTAAEAQAASEYAYYMKESTASKKSKHELEFKTSLAKDQTLFDKEQVEKDLAAEQAELEQANKYYEYLKPNCNQVHVSYEERKAKREEEIAALKEAYKMLDEIAVA